MPTVTLPTSPCKNDHLLAYALVPAQAYPLIVSVDIEVSYQVHAFGVSGGDQTDWTLSLSESFNIATRDTTNKVSDAYDARPIADDNFRLWWRESNPPVPRIGRWAFQCFKTFSFPDTLIGVDNVNMSFYSGALSLATVFECYGESGTGFGPRLTPSAPDGMLYVGVGAEGGTGGVVEPLSLTGYDDISYYDEVLHLLDKPSWRTGGSASVTGSDSLTPPGSVQYDRDWTFALTFNT